VYCSLLCHLVKCHCKWFHWCIKNNIKSKYVRTPYNMTGQAFGFSTPATVMTTRIMRRSFSFLPLELVYYVAEYLLKAEQYQCLSLCRSWTPLLYDCRTICIFDEDDDTVFGYFPHENLWAVFRDSQEH
jgi:hypothetical protein